VRDLDTIDSELRLLAAVRRSIREHVASRRVVRSMSCSTNATLQTNNDASHVDELPCTERGHSAASR
jgi:hypothetical protein